MICYFDDNDKVNLSYIDHINNVRPLEYLKARLSNSQFEFVHSKKYNIPGLYVIEVSKHAPWWCAKTTIPASRAILELIPSHVISAVKERKLRILIIAIIEGDNFVSEEFDGYRALTKSVCKLGLPENSVLILSGNLNAGKQYHQWCQKFNEKPIIEFIGGIEWDGKDIIATSDPISVSDKNTKDFNSLNRAHRRHRSEHLFFLAEHNLLENSLVSGGVWFGKEIINPPEYQSVDYEYYKNKLLENYPRVIDFPADYLELNSPNSISNQLIYENSYLSIVTESHFSEEGGLFITEKTMRPILVGHPFMVLGQPNILKKLEELGFKTEFEGLDTSYDSIEDNKERFLHFHQSLLGWVKTPDKHNIAKLWKETIEHNFQNYKNLNLKKTMFDCVIKSTKEYFRI